MKITACVLALLATVAVTGTSFAAKQKYAATLCAYKGFTCMKVKSGDTWHKLFPDPKQRKIVQRLNRTNTALRYHRIIVVPDNLSNLNHMDLSPFPNTVAATGVRQIIVKLSLHAFGAYDKNGRLVHWGPISGGKGWCPDVNRRCTTKQGAFKIMRKGDASCVSSKFPVGKGGAKMPYCMFYHGGFAMHGSTLPGYHASHGCIRMNTDDAKWINHHFSSKGETRVIVEK